MKEGKELIDKKDEYAIEDLKDNLETFSQIYQRGKMFINFWSLSNITHLCKYSIIFQ